MTSFYLRCNTGLNWVKLGRCGEETPLRFRDFVLHKDSVILKSDDRFFNLRILVYACIKINMQHLFLRQSSDNFESAIHSLKYSMSCLFKFIHLFTYISQQLCGNQN